MNTKTWLAVGAGAVVLFWLWRTKWGGDSAQAAQPYPDALPSDPYLMPSPAPQPMATPQPVPSAAEGGGGSRFNMTIDPSLFQDTTNNESTSEPRLTQPTTHSVPITAGPASVQVQFNTSREAKPAASINYRASAASAARILRESAAKKKAEEQVTIIGVNGIGNVFFG